MKKQVLKKQHGLTLLEMLLVIGVITSIVYMAVGYMQRQMFENTIARASIQMQQILNGAAAYYVANNSWPSSIDAMKPAFIPNIDIKSPFGTDYTIGSTSKIFYVSVSIKGQTNALVLSRANILIGRLPLAYVTQSVAASPPEQAGCTTDTCFVVTQINIPAQTLNKSMGISFAGLFHHGGCVPVPKCKVAGMLPQIFVVPVSVSGVNDDTLAANTPAVYPISSFTAYATGTAIESNPPACTVGKAQPACGGNTPSGFYWRACVDIVTQRGNVAQTRTDSAEANYWGQSVTLGAFTRCASSTEQSGSTFSVFSN